MKAIFESLQKIMDTALAQAKTEKDKNAISKTKEALQKIADSDATTIKEKQAELMRIVEQLKNDVQFNHKDD